MSNRRCLLCEGRGPFRVLVADGLPGLGMVVAGKTVEARPVGCPTCGIVFLDPPTDQTLLDRHYASQGRIQTETDAYAEQAEFIGLTEGDVLDVGAFDGRLLREIGLRTNGWSFSASGIEPDADVRPVVKYHRYSGPAAVPDNSFDLICFGHVIEHLPNPLSYLERARSWLRPGGRLFIEVPNLETPYIQLVPYFTPFHLWYFTGATLIDMLARAGFHVVAGPDRTRYGAMRVLARPIHVALPHRFVSDYSFRAAKRWLADYGGEIERITRLLSGLNGKPIAIFGAGQHTRLLLNLAANSPRIDLRPLRLLATNTDGHQEFMGLPVLPAVPENWADVDAVILSSYDSTEAMAEIVGPKAFRLYDRVAAYDTWKRDRIVE